MKMLCLLGVMCIRDDEVKKMQEGACRRKRKEAAEEGRDEV